jgi:hypothetical protein
LLQRGDMLVSVARSPHTYGMVKGFRAIELGIGREDAPPPIQACDHAGCSAEGLYRAPKSRDRLNDYFWFCLDHIRDYNRAWDYYAGMKPEQIEAAVRRDTVWDRPTWPLGRWSSTRRIFGREFIPEDADPFAERRTAPEQARPKSKIEQALAELALAPGATAEEIKRRYKALAKKFHPDANGGDKSAEERFKAINLAYSTLKNSAAV